MKMLCILLIFFVQGFIFSDHYDVAVIGSGPAGLSAALVTAKEKHSTAVFLGDRPGGPLNAITCMGNWPGSIKGKGKDVIKRLFYQTKKKGAEYKNQTIASVDLSRRPFLLRAEDGSQHFAKSLIIATGALPRRLHLENGGIQGVETFVYKQDAMRFSGKTVAVVGGGIDAVKKACIIAKHAENVYLIVRESSLQKQRWKKRLRKKGKGKIEALYETEVVKIHGDGEKLTSVDLSSQRRLQVDHLVLAIGIEPNSLLVQGQVGCDERGFILLEGRSQKTSILGVFAAGTVTDPIYRQAAIAAGEGMKAGYDACRFLKITRIRD